MLKLSVLQEAMNSGDVKLLAIYDVGISAWSYPVVTRMRDFFSFLMGYKSYRKSNPVGDDDLFPLYFKFPDSYDLYICGKFNLASDRDSCPAFSHSMPVKIGSLKDVIDYLWSEYDGKD